MALFSSCASDDTIFENNQKENNIRFTASIEGCIDTRATLVSNKPNWEAGDVISIDGHDYEASSSGVTTPFTGTGATETTHHAYFPASIYNGGTPTLPAVQSYEEGKFNMPMYAESSTEELEFKNICTVLAVSVSNADIDQVKAIKVASTSKALSGAFTVASDGTMTMTAPDDASKTVTLTCETAVSMTTAEKVFYIAIPAQTYSDLKIYVSSDGTSFNKCMATKKAEGLGALARNKILNIPYETNAVQLWADGPFFATSNVTSGSTIFFQWCATTPGGSYYSGAYDLEHDTCAKLWGSAWRMPTLDEWQDLKNNCFDTQLYSDVPPYSFIFTGSNGNRLSILVNQANVAWSKNGTYWSSATDGTKAKCVAIWCNSTTNGFDVGIGRSRSTSDYFVRAVLQ